jgi:O-antigen biosynthesis protein WbqV
MGATKRLAELHLAGCERENTSQMQVKSVRFGNVMGSQGSVLPRFQSQIESGGPLEVTHAEMERYFMSAQEAVGLILTVTAHDDVVGGVYIMEMGAALSIMDLGREMIRTSGKLIDIEITGLRSGEKLKEQLFDEYETLSSTSLPSVFQVAPTAADAFLPAADVAHLAGMVRTRPPAVVRQRVFACLDERLCREERATG